MRESRKPKPRAEAQLQSAAQVKAAGAAEGKNSIDLN
jgi:hypothetical protein